MLLGLLQDNASSVTTRPLLNNYINLISKLIALPQLARSLAAVAERHPSQ